jgi:hypothetical protein
MKTEELDKLFDSGEVDITPYLDMSKAYRPDYEQKRININFPLWLLKKIDNEAGRIGVARQSLIKIWLAERLAKI